MLYVLTDIRAKLDRLGNRIEPTDSDFHIERIESLDQFDALEEKLSGSRENQRQMVTIC